MENMAPISELVLRTSICNYIYSLTTLATKLAKKKKVVILFYIVFILFPLRGTGKINRPLSS